MKDRVIEQFNQNYCKERGAIGIWFPFDDKEHKEVVAGIKKKGAKYEFPGTASVIKLHMSVFSKNVWVAMGPREICAAMVRQLTDTKGHFDLDDNTHQGICVRVNATNVAIWIDHIWQELRDPTVSPLLVHEALHAVEAVMALSNMKPHRQNEELRAYMQDWLVSTVLDIASVDYGNWCEIGLDIKSINPKIT